MNEPRLTETTERRSLILRSLDAPRWLNALDYQREHGTNAYEVFAARWPGSLSKAGVEEWRTRAAVGGAPTAWGSALSTPPAVTGPLVALSRDRMLVGRLQPLARRAAVNVAIPVEAFRTANFSWSGSGRPTPMSAGSLDTVTVRPAAPSGLTAVTNDLVKLKSPGADATMAELLTAGTVDFIDDQFVDPTQTGNASDPFWPASITAGVTPVTSSTGDVLDDTRSALAHYAAQGGRISTAAILLSSKNAAALALRSGTHGSPIVNLTATGGVLAGCPAFAADALADLLVVLDLQRLFIADDGQMDLDFAGAASLQMVDDPTNHSGTPAATTTVSMFQAGSTAIRITRFISWAYAGPMAIVDGCSYLSMGGSPA